MCFNLNITIEIVSITLSYDLNRSIESNYSMPSFPVVATVPDRPFVQYILILIIIHNCNIDDNN